MEISIKRLVDRSEKTFFFKDHFWYLNNYLKIERGFGWKKSEKILLLLTNVFRDLVLKRHLFRINCLIHCKKSVRIRSYSVWMQENADQNNSEYGRFSGSDFARHSFLSKDKWKLTSFGIADTIGRFIREKNNLAACSFSHIPILASAVKPWWYKKKWSNKNFNLRFDTDTVLSPLSVPGAYWSF